MFRRLEPKPRRHSVDDLAEQPRGQCLTYTLEAKIVAAQRTADARHREMIAADMERLGRVSRELLALIRRRAAEITGQPWATVIVSERNDSVQVHQRKITGKLDRYRLGKKIAWVYRDEIEDYLTGDMIALINGYWQRWRGQQAISTELVERIVARRTFALLG